MKSLRLASLLLLCASSATAQAPASDAARDSVLATIENFLVGLRTKDTAIMKANIDTLTRMTLLRPAPGGGTRVLTLSGAQFIDVVSRPTQPALDEPIRNAIVHIDGPLASVWAEYQVRRDGRVTHCGFDAFHLARLDGKWKILNVSDSFRQTGCGDPWPAKP
jgi:hypothetical protein